jgi:hypothetical protein
MAEWFYRTGLALAPSEKDRRFIHEWEAIEEANRMTSSARGFDSVICVWDERDDPLYLFWGGERFKRV